MRRLIQQAKAHPYLAVGLLLTAGLAVGSALCADRQIVINTSPSVAPGLYIRSDKPPAVGRLVDFRVPPAAAAYVRSRTHGKTSGNNWYILKPVAAGPGDRVDTRGDWLAINGHRVAPMPPVSGTDGMPLPRWAACRTLAPDEFFVFSARVPNSFDSRCYGPVHRAQIESVRRPLLTW